MPNKKINQLTPRTPTLTDLILVGDPATGYSYKATLSAMINFVGGNIQFSSLGGISLTNPTNGQVLTFNGTNWVNQTPAAAPVTSVFGRTGAVVAAEGDYSLTQLSDVTISSPTNGQVLKYNGTAWVNGSDTDTGITSLNGLTATTQTFATGSSGTDFNISSATSTHTFNLPTASATNRGALSSSDWTTFNAKQNTITLATIGNSGAATFISNTLNIPNYTLAGLGGITLNSLAASSPLSYDSITGIFSIQIANSTQNGYLSSLSFNTFTNKQNAITLTTTGSSGSATFISDTLNIPTYTLAGLGGITLTSLSASSPLSYNNTTGAFTIQVANTSQDGYLSSTDWNNFNGKQNTITLTTTGSSGSSTLVGATLNIPTYTLAGLGGISLSSLSASAPLSYNSGTGAFSITQASGSTNGFLSSTDWTTFNNKQSTITLTTTGSSGASTFISNTLNIPNYTLAGLGGVSGSGTTNYVSKWTGSSALGNSQIFDNGTSVGIGTTSPAARLDVSASNNEIRSTGTSSTYTQYNAFIPSGVNMRIGAFATNNGFLGTTTNHPFNIETNNTQRARFFANGNLLIGSGTTDGGYLLDVSGTTRISGTELRLDNGTTGTLNIYSNTPTINFFSGGGYTFGRSGTTMNLNSAGSINMQIGGNDAYAISSANGHIWRSAISGGAALGRLTTGGNLIVGGITDAGYRADIQGTFRVTTDTYLATNAIANLVGIGTTSPTHKLDIVRNDASTTPIVSISNNTAQSTSRSIIRFAPNTATGQIGTVASTWTIDANINANETYLYGTHGILLYNGSSTAPTRFFTNTSEKMRLTAAGRLLLGTTTESTFLLDVNGSTRIGSIISETISGYVELRTAIATALRVRNTTGGIWLEGSEINCLPTTIMTISTSALPQNYILLGGGTGSGANSTRINTNNGYGYNWGLNIGADGTRVMQIFTGGNVTFEKGVSNTSTNNSSALVTLNSTTQGFLPPRMTNAQMVAIATPASGLMVYDTTNNKLNYYNGTAWTAL